MSLFWHLQFSGGTEISGKLVEPWIMQTLLLNKVFLDR